MAKLKMYTISWPDVTVWKDSEKPLVNEDINIFPPEIKITHEVEINECNGEVFFTLLSSDQLGLVELTLIQNHLGYPPNKHGFKFILRKEKGNKIIHKWSCSL